MFLIAALLVLLVYPSTHPLAASPDNLSYQVPNIISSKSIAPPIDMNDADDDDDGDADSIGGVRGAKSNPGNTSDFNRPGNRTNFVLTLQMWWNFLIGIR